MVSLSRLPATSMLGKPFADYLNVSTGFENAQRLREATLPTLEALGAFCEVTEGLFQFYKIGVVKGQVKLLPHGTVKFGRRGRVATLSASGWVLGRLRQEGLFGEYLAGIAEVPHRVTMLHATADYQVPSPSQHIHSVWDAAIGGLLSLSRKSLRPSQCSHVFSADDEGVVSGTVYLGQRQNADIWAKVYDKQRERMARGFADPGPLVRVEVACMSDVRATLQDAYDPTELFFHVAGRSLVEVPDGLQGWSGAGEGFVLEKARERLPYERFEAFLHGSVDARRLAQMALDLYGSDVAPQALGRAMLQLIQDHAPALA